MTTNRYSQYMILSFNNIKKSIYLNLYCLLFLYVKYQKWLTWQIILNFWKVLFACFFNVSMKGEGSCECTGPWVWNKAVQWVILQPLDPVCRDSDLSRAGWTPNSSSSSGSSSSAPQHCQGLRNWPLHTLTDWAIISQSNRFTLK